RTDDYFWLREKENPAVIDYLKAENAFTESTMAPTKPLQDRLYAEMLGRIKETDTAVPYRKGGYFYYTRTEEKKSFPIFCRKKGSLEAKEEVIFDQNARAAEMGVKFLSLGAFDVSPDHKMLAVSFDTSGAERYTMRFKNLADGSWLPDEVPDTYYSSA